MLLHLPILFQLTSRYMSANIIVNVKTAPRPQRQVKQSWVANKPDRFCMAVLFLKLLAPQYMQLRRPIKYRCRYNAARVCTHLMHINAYNKSVYVWKYSPNPFSEHFHLVFTYPHDIQTISIFLAWHFSCPFLQLCIFAKCSGMQDSHSKSAHICKILDNFSPCP